MAAQELMPGIVSDPEIMGGRPIIKGRRITVSQIIGHLAAGDSIEVLCEEYGLTVADVRAALAFAVESVQARESRYVVNPSMLDG